MPNHSEKIIAGYFPVIHTGYLDLLNHSRDATIGILGNDVLATRFDYLRKDIRALSAEQALPIITGLGRAARIITEAALTDTMSTPDLTMPDDDVSRALSREFAVEPKLLPVFLRWDRENSTVNTEVVADRVVSISSKEPLINALYEAARQSPNWWRHVAAAIADTNGSIDTVTFNTSMPTTFSSTIDGDPRMTARRGESIERSIDIHAEARAIAHCAAEGLATTDKSIYVTTFPCANCAKLIVEAGIKQCYFIEGYATIDGQTVLKSNNVEIIKIDTELPEIDTRQLRLYPAN